MKDKLFFTKECIIVEQSENKMHLEDLDKEKLIQD